MLQAYRDAVTTQEPPLPLVLFVPYFKADSAKRELEINQSVISNIRSGIFSRIVIIAEGECGIEGLGPLPGFVEYVRSEQRTTYAMWALLTRKHCSQPYISILSNSDIIFDRDVGAQALLDTKESRTLLCISRWEIAADGGAELHSMPHWSQDAWCMRSVDAETIPELAIKELDVPMGVPRCDNKIAYLFWLNGWKVVNPCHRIKILHNHASGIRSYQKKDPTIRGAVAYVHPSPQSGCASEIELDIYTLNSKDPSGLRLNRYLCDGDEAAANSSEEINISAIEAVAGDAGRPCWQTPNATEMHAASLVANSRLAQSFASYVGLPWATMIDRRCKGVPMSEAHSIMHSEAVQEDFVRATVCQHIWALDHFDLFLKAGITDLFWSHAPIGLLVHNGIRIHPFPLYPVRCVSHPSAGSSEPLSNRSLLYSFQGAYQTGLYLSSAREWILALPPRRDAKLEHRKEWHYEQSVYREQVLGQQADQMRHVALSAEADAYARTLQSSCFALCPSGSGPNSIRLWEALGYGAIPVIISERLQLPGPFDLWQAAAVFVPETQEAVAALPSQLEALASDHRRLVAMREAGQLLWNRYGAESFISDVVEFLDDPLAALCTRARLRLSADHLEVRAESPGTLPLEVRRSLHSAAPDCPLLIVIADRSSPEILNVRWRAALQMCAERIGARPWAVASVSPALEAFGSTP